LTIIFEILGFFASEDLHLNSNVTVMLINLPSIIKCSFIRKKQVFHKGKVSLDLTSSPITKSLSALKVFPS